MTLPLLCVVVLSSCASSDITPRKLLARGLFSILPLVDAQQREHDRRIRRELVIFMNLETMFPDESVKRLADAAGRGRIRRAEELVLSGVDVNSRGNKGATPLFWALRKKNLAGFVRLLELGADPNLLFGISGSVMHWAAKAEDTRFLRAALAHGGDPNLVAKTNGESPLFDAVIHSAYDTDFEGSSLQVLLDAGGDVNAIAKGVSGLFYQEKPLVISACVKGNFKLLYELLVRGADPEARSKYSPFVDGSEKLLNPERDPKGRPLAECIAKRLAVLRPEYVAKPEVTRVIRWLEERGVQIPDPEAFRPTPGKGIENVLLKPDD